MPVDQGHRQSHNVEVTAFDALDEFGGQALDGVSAGLVHGLAAGGIFRRSPGVRAAQTRRSIPAQSSIRRTGDRRQMPVSTSWRWPESIFSMRRASAASSGFASISPWMETVVSAARMISPGAGVTAAALARRCGSRSRERPRRAAAFRRRPRAGSGMGYPPAAGCRGGAANGRLTRASSYGMRLWGRSMHEAGCRAN